MPTPLVIDTSVVYKWLRPDAEESVERALAVAREAAAGVVDLVAPAILPVELANAVRYGTVDADDAGSVLELFEGFHFLLYEADCRRLVAAMGLAFDHGLSVYDALFLQLAEELSCPLITADRRAFAGVYADVEIRLL